MPTPIKRTSSLISYSKEHHFGLLLVWKIRQGIKREIITERIANYILYFFEADLKYHFKDEERYLFTLLPTNNNLRQIAEQEHSKIFNLITSIHLDKTNETLEIIKDNWINSWGVYPNLGLSEPEPDGEIEEKVQETDFKKTILVRLTSFLSYFYNRFNTQFSLVFFSIFDNVF